MEAILFGWDIEDGFFVEAGASNGAHSNTLLFEKMWNWTGGENYWETYVRTFKRFSEQRPGCCKSIWETTNLILANPVHNNFIEWVVRSWVYSCTWLKHAQSIFGIDFKWKTFPGLLVEPTPPLYKELLEKNRDSAWTARVCLSRTKRPEYVQFGQVYKFGICL